MMMVSGGDWDRVVDAAANEAGGTAVTTSPSDTSCNGSYHNSDCSDDEVCRAILLALVPSKHSRPHRNRRTVLIPRVVRCDVRRFMATMFVNSVNSHSGEMLRGYFDRYAGKGITMEKILPPSANAPASFGCQQQEIYQRTNSKIVRICGVQSIAEYWTLLMELSPDNAVSIEDVQLHTYAYTERSKLSCRFLVEVTNVYDISPLAVANSLNSTQHSSQREGLFDEARAIKRCRLADPPATSNAMADSIEPSKPTGASPMCTKENSSRKLSSCETLRMRVIPKPVSIQISGTMTFVINAQRQVESIVFNNAAPIILQK